MYGKGYDNTYYISFDGSSQKPWVKSRSWYEKGHFICLDISIVLKAISLNNIMTAGFPPETLSSLLNLQQTITNDSRLYLYGHGSVGYRAIGSNITEKEITADQIAQFLNLLLVKPVFKTNLSFNNLTISLLSCYGGIDGLSGNHATKSMAGRLLTKLKKYGIYATTLGRNFACAMSYCTDGRFVKSIVEKENITQFTILIRQRKELIKNQQYDDVDIIDKKIASLKKHKIPNSKTIFFWTPEGKPTSRDAYSFRPEIVIRDRIIEIIFDSARNKKSHNKSIIELLINICATDKELAQNHLTYIGNIPELRSDSYIKNAMLDDEISKYKSVSDRHDVCHMIAAQLHLLSQHSGSLPQIRAA